MDLPSAPRAFWLLARLRLLRVLNIANALRFSKGWPGPSRPATHGKTKVRWMATCVLAAFMLFAFIHTASNSLLNMQCRLPPGSHCTAMAEADAQLPDAPFHPVVMRAATMSA